MTLNHITLAEFESLIQGANLPLDTRLTVTVEDENVSNNLIGKQKAMTAMKKLKGSGNGRLVDLLLNERRKEKYL